MCRKTIFPTCTVHSAQPPPSTRVYTNYKIIFCHSPFPAVRWVTFSLIWLHAPRRLSISVSSCLTSTCKRWSITEEKFWKTPLKKHFFHPPHLIVCWTVGWSVNVSLSRVKTTHTHTLTILLSLSPSPTLGGAGSQEVHTGSYSQTCAILKDVQNREYSQFSLYNAYHHFHTSKLGCLSAFSWTFTERKFC